MDSEQRAEEMAEQAKHRAAIYDFLSRVFLQEPSTEFLQAILDEDSLRSFRELGLDLARDLTGKKLEEVEQQLAIAYCAIFIGPEETSLFPYESVQRHGCYEGKSTAEVEDFYSKCSLALPKDALEMPDHLGIEFDFMNKLAHQEALHWEKGELELAEQSRGRQQEFLRNHILVWVPNYCKKVEKQSPHHFYSQIGEMTREFLSLEWEEMLGEED